jgi:hypothetical protein
MSFPGSSTNGSSSTTKPIVFYSKYCDYSRSLLNDIAKRNLRDLFYFVNIDDAKVKTPKFVDRVPLIYIHKERRIIVDEGVQLYMTSIMKERDEGQLEVEPFMFHEMSGSLSDKYSHLTDNQDFENCGPKLFAKITDECRINTLSETEVASKSSGSSEVNNLEKLIAMRNSDPSTKIAQNQF